MPRKEIPLEAGRIPPDIDTLVQSLFGSGVASRLERLGGRLLVTLAVPYVPPKDRTASRAVDMDDLLGRLRAAKGNSMTIEPLLKPLTVQQLRQIAKKLEQPVRANIGAGVLREEILRTLGAERHWRGIAGEEE